MTSREHGESLRTAPAIRVLIVDDDRDELILLERSISASWIEVVATTDSGEHAVDLARLLDPDLALIDWDMPRFGGALTARLIERYAPRCKPVLLLDDDDDPREEGDRGGRPLAAIPKHSGRDAMRDLLCELAATHVASNGRERHRPGDGASVIRCTGDPVHRPGGSLTGCGAAVLE